MMKQTKAEAAPVSGQHTPTPWKLGTQDYAYFEEGVETVKHSAQGIDAEGVHDICRVSLCAAEEGIANAAFIVRACNAHDELVEALRALVEAYDTPQEDYCGQCAEAMVKARAILAKAERGEQ